MRFVLVAFVLAACADPSECELPPDTTMYSCEPIASGSGCMGGPRWFTDSGVRQDDLDKLFPDSCYADIPQCSTLYKGSRRQFTCQFGGWGEEL
jgi:hypothetical protein